MNVVGIQSAPPPQVAPAVAPVAPAAHTATDPQEHKRSSEDDKRQQQQRRPAVQVPRMKPLSTTEVRVMLGMAPPEALRDEQQRQLRQGGFDQYA